MTNHQRILLSEVSHETARVEREPGRIGLLAEAMRKAVNAGCSREHVIGLSLLPRHQAEQVLDA